MLLRKNPGRSRSSPPVAALKRLAFAVAGRASSAMIVASCIADSASWTHKKQVWRIRRRVAALELEPRPWNELIRLKLKNDQLDPSRSPASWLNESRRNLISALSGDIKWLKIMGLCVTSASSLSCQVTGTVSTNVSPPSRTRASGYPASRGLPAATQQCTGATVVPRAPGEFPRPLRAKSSPLWPAELQRIVNCGEMT